MAYAAATRQFPELASLRWSAIPLPCLMACCEVLEGKQGSGPKGDEVLWNTRGILVNSFSAGPGDPCAWVHDPGPEMPAPGLGRFKPSKIWLKSSRSSPRPPRSWFRLPRFWPRPSRACLKLLRVRSRGACPRPGSSLQRPSLGLPGPGSGLPGTGWASQGLAEVAFGQNQASKGLYKKSNDVD